MRNKYRLDDYEVNIILTALIELRNQMIREDRHTDPIDELILKLGI